MPQHDYHEIEHSLAAFIEPGSIFEVRLLYKNRKQIDAAYFNNFKDAATIIADLDDPYLGIYFTPNPVLPELFSRAANRFGDGRTTTRDTEIISRKWLLVDIDPIRATGISSTDAQLDHAFKVARHIAGVLEFKDGWPRPYINASGNGAHLMYAIDEPNTDYVRDEIHKFLKILDKRFNDGQCSVDLTVFNASRIWRLPGTWARKGDNLPERPHRKASILQTPDTLTKVSLKRITDHNVRYGDLLNPPKNGKHYSALDGPEHKYRHINDQAMVRLADWVPELFPAAYEYQGGYRVKSEDLGQHWEEDLGIHPLGIKHFGPADQGDPTEGKRTPIALVAEMFTTNDKDLAASTLAGILNISLSEFSTLPVIGLDSATIQLPGFEPPAKKKYDFRNITTLGQIQKKTFKERIWIVPGLLTTGCMLLAARPKMRKTFFALQLAMAVSEGLMFLGKKCNKHEVLFLGLEDNERRMRERSDAMDKFNFDRPDYNGLHIFTGGMDVEPNTGTAVLTEPAQAAETFKMFPKGLEGVEALKQYLDYNPKCKLVVIDTLARWRDKSNERDVYQRDYDQMEPLQTLATERDILIILVHHEKKGLAGQNSGDFMEDVSGTSGLTGGTDGVISIKGVRGMSDEAEARKLFITGRDIPHDISIDMAFDTNRGGWTVAQGQDTRNKIRTLLTQHPVLTKTEVFNSMAGLVTRTWVYKVLDEMKLNGEIEHGVRGYYLKREAWQGAN